MKTRMTAHRPGALRIHAGVRANVARRRGVQGQLDDQAVEAARAGSLRLDPSSRRRQFTQRIGLAGQRIPGSRSRIYGQARREVQHHARRRPLRLRGISQGRRRRRHLPLHARCAVSQGHERAGLQRHRRGNAVRHGGARRIARFREDDEGREVVRPRHRHAHRVSHSRRHTAIHPRDPRRWPDHQRQRQAGGIPHSRRHAGDGAGGSQVGPDGRARTSSSRSASTV